MNLKGKNDREGLVGYHTRKDGSLEKVTAEQVYAWMFGVEIGGKHKAVKSGQKVWYKTGKGGWKVPLKVGGAKPKGAKGYVVARDLAWADKLGVRDAGTYRAYAYFYDGAGFAPTALAQATVKVAKAKNPMVAKGGAVTASAGKARSFKKSAAFKVSKAKGAVTFEKANKAGGKKVTVDKKTGKLTVKAGLKAGKTYKVKVKVKVTAKGNKNYKKAAKTVTLTVKVK